MATELTRNHEEIKGPSTDTWNKTNITPVIGTQTKKESNTEAKVNIEQQKTSPCKYCNKAISNKKELNIHEKFQCRESRCAICNKKVENKYELLAHEAETHKFTRGKNGNEDQEKARITEIRRAEQEQNDQKKPNEEATNTQKNNGNKQGYNKTNQDEAKVPTKHEPEEKSNNTAIQEKDEISHDSDNKQKYSKNIIDMNQENNPNIIARQQGPRESNKNGENKSELTLEMDTNDTSYKKENSDKDKNTKANKNDKRENKKQKSKRNKNTEKKQNVNPLNNQEEQKQHNETIKAEISKLIKK